MARDIVLSTGVILGGKIDLQFAHLVEEESSINNHTSDYGYEGEGKDVVFLSLCHSIIVLITSN